MPNFFTLDCSCIKYLLPLLSSFTCLPFTSINVIPPAANPPFLGTTETDSPFYIIDIEEVTL